MTRHVVTLANERLRQRAHEYVDQAKLGSRLEFLGPKRSTNQNAAMWAMLSDLAEQLAWYGQKMTAEDFKLLMLDALRREHRDQMRVVPNIDRTGFVDISNTHSSELSHEEMGMLLTIISAFGDQHGVVWSEPKSPKDARPVPPVEAYEESLR